MARFTGTVRQHYHLEAYDLLVLETDYRGDVGPGDALSVELPAGERAEIEVHDVAWGSALTADNPPLTLIVKGLRGREPAPGARIQ